MTTTGRVGGRSCGTDVSSKRGMAAVRASASYWERKVGIWKIRIKEEQSGCYETVRTNKTHLHSHTAFILILVEPS